MINDPIVEEVHQTRQRIFAACNGDLDRLIERLKTADSQNEQRHVTVAEVQKRSSAPKAAT